MRERQRLLGLASQVGARILGAAVTVLLAVFVARNYGVEYSGAFYFLLSSIAVLGILTRLGTEQYLTASVTPRVGSGKGATLPFLFSSVSAVGLLIVITSTLFVITYVLAPGTVAIALGKLSSPFYLTGAVVGFNSIWLVSAYCRSMGWATTAILLENALQSIWLFLLFVGWTITGDPPPIHFVALAIFGIAPALLGPIFLFFRKEARAGFTRVRVSAALWGAVGFASVTVTNSIIVWLPVQVLGYFGNFADVGIYNAAFRVTMLVGAFGVLIKCLVIRRYIDSGPTDIREKVNARRALRESALVGIVFFGVSILVAWQGSLVAAIFGEGFEEVSTVLPLMLLAQTVNVSGYVMETQLVLMQKRSVLNLNALFTLIASATLTPILISVAGLTGAVLGFLISIVVSRGHLAIYYLRRSIRDS